MKDLKIKHIFRDNSDFVYGVAFEIGGEKYLVQEKDVEGEDFLTLYQVNEKGSRSFLQRVNCNSGGLGKACQCNVEKTSRKHSQWKKACNTRGHSKKQALLSIPYSQYNLETFANFLDYYFFDESSKVKDKLVSQLNKAWTIIADVSNSKSYYDLYKKCPEVENSVQQALKLLIKAINDV